MKNKKKSKQNVAVSDQSNQNTPRSAIAQLEAQLKSAEGEAAPIQAKVREYTDSVRQLTQELRDKVSASVGGVIVRVPKYDLTPEERLSKEKELVEKEKLLVGYERMLQPHTTKIEQLKDRIKGVQEKAEGHRKQVAVLESSDYVDRIRVKAEEARHEAKKLIEQAERMEAERQAKIATHAAEVKRLTGSEV